MAPRRRRTTSLITAALALLLAAPALTRSAAAAGGAAAASGAATATAVAASCSWWYESTAHGSLPGGAAVFVDAVRDAGAVGDGVTDDTAALLRALDANATGLGGSNVSRSARVVYLRAGTYLIRDTLTVWFWTQLVGNPLPGCASTLLLAPNSSGFGDASGLLMKPVVAANGGFNLSAAPGAWQIVERTRGGHANDLFYASVRDLSIVVGAGNPGAVALYWPVAQQTAVRSVLIDLTASGAIGLDMAGVGFAPANGAAAFVPSVGGGGQVDSLTVKGGRIGMRLAGSQWTYTNIDLSLASEACVHSSGMIWSHTFVRLRTMECPAALALSGAIGAVLLIDSRLGPLLGPSAIVTDGTSAVVLQNVVLDVFAQQTRFLIDDELPAPELCCLVVGSWARGPLFVDGVRADANASGREVPLPSRQAAREAGVPLACPNPATQVPNLCGGSMEDPDSGIQLIYRPSFAVGAAVSNARTDFGAAGDGLTDDTAALSAAFSRSNSVTFLPFGTYAVRAGELVLGCNASVVGEALSTLALFAGAAPQPGADGALLALLATPADASCSATLVDLSLSSLGTGNDGAVLLDHQAGAGSYLADVTMRIVYRVGLKATIGRVGGAPGTGAGQLSNCWWWGMDHNLTDMVGMDCSSPGCVDHMPPGQIRGVRIATKGPLFLLGTNFEHSNETEYLFDEGAANVVGSVIQTEGSLVSLNISGAAGPIVLFGGLFGSGSGHNATTYAQRGPASASCAGGVDVSYRLLGTMTKQPLNYSIVDSTRDGRGFAASAPASSTGWELASVINTC